MVVWRQAVWFFVQPVGLFFYRFFRQPVLLTTQSWHHLLQHRRSLHIRIVGVGVFLKGAQVLQGSLSARGLLNHGVRTQLEVVIQMISCLFHQWNVDLAIIPLYLTASHSYPYTTIIFYLFRKIICFLRHHFVILLSFFLIKGQVLIGIPFGSVR